mmetsp:Transcript_16374/g.17109  ORF Transcript_16374/g.17109 Transcript_16374/m.17109 type:complete len:203 (+) Transcript_16374:2-610(+)
MPLEISLSSLPFLAIVISFYIFRNVKKKSIYLPSYKRSELAISPAFGNEYIVGNLNSIVKEIETHILNSMNKDKNVKENYPFHCIINPPRHGKSLLIDRLFVNNEEVVVISITYNSTTGLVKGETDNPETAIKWFWIRVLKSMLQIPDELETLSYLLQPDQCSWSHIKSIIVNGLSSNPFIDNNGNDYIRIGFGECGSEFDE